MQTLKLNGQSVTVASEDDTPLLWVLRGELKLIGTKFGCGTALCGACTVHIDGQPSVADILRSRRMEHLRQERLAREEAAAKAAAITVDPQPLELESAPEESEEKPQG